MYWKFIYRLLGGHYHVSVFTSLNQDGTFAKLGDLIMDERDFSSLKSKNYIFIFEEKE